jgi:hypothetical protein
VRWLFEDVEPRLGTIEPVTLCITCLLQDSKTIQSFDGALCRCRSTDRYFQKSIRSKLRLAPICVVENKSGNCFVTLRSEKLLQTLFTTATCRKLNRISPLDQVFHLFALINLMNEF